MGLFRGFLFAVSFVSSGGISAWAQSSGSGNSCGVHLHRPVIEKVFDEVVKLNPEISSAKNDPFQLYKDLKSEEASWHKRGGYLDFNKKITPEQKQRIQDNYKLNLEEMKTDHEYVLFYLNQIHFIYIRVSNAIYDKILTESKVIALTPRLKKHARAIIDSFFFYNLQSQNLSGEMFSETVAQAPWKSFPWKEALEILERWEKQEVQGPREMQVFIQDIQAEYRDRMPAEAMDRIHKSMRSFDFEKVMCCKTGKGCSSCPLNRRFKL